MRLYRNAVILLAVLVVIVGAFVLLSIFDKKTVDNTETEAPVENLSVLDVEKENIAEITMENKEVKYILSHNDKDFELTYPSGIKYDTALVNGTFDNISKLTADKVIEDNGSNLTKFGLDNPATDTVKMKDGTVKVLEIGSETPTKESVYVKLKGSDKIYLVSSNIISTLKVNGVYYKERRLFTPEKEDLNEIRMERNGDTSFTLDKNSDGKWAITSPVSGNVNEEQLDTMLNYFSSFSVWNFVDDKSPDLSVYGLDKPSYVMEVKSKTGSMKLLLGKEKTRDTEMYGKLADSNDIFVLTLSSLNFLDVPLSDLFERFVYSTDIKDVTDIQADMDGQVTNCVLQLDPGGNKDKDKFTVNGKDASGKDENGDFYFRAYYKALISLMFTDLDINAKPTGTPEITFTYRLNKSPGTVKVELIPRNTETYYAMVDGKYTGKIVYKRDFDEPEGIREAYKKLMQSIDKK